MKKLALPLLLSLTTLAHAADLTWTGAESTTAESGVNWNSGLAPTTGDTLTFGELDDRTESVVHTTPGTFAKLNFSGATTRYVLSGGALNLTDGIASTGAANATVNNALTLGGAAAVNVTGAGVLTLGGSLTGTLNKTGTGTLALSGQSQLDAITVATSTGVGLRIEQGAVVTTGSLNGDTPAKKLNVVSAGDLTVTGSFSVNDNTAGNASFTQTGGTVNLTTSVDDAFTNGLAIAQRVNATGTNAYNLEGGVLNVANTKLYGAVGGAARGQLNISGGTANLKGLTLTGTSASAIGTLNLTGGRLNLGTDGLAKGGGTANVNLGAGTLGAYADWTGGVNATLTAGNRTLVDTLDAADGVTARTIKLTGVLGGQGGLTKVSAGTLELSGANTFTGGLRVEGGSVVANHNKALGNGDVTLAGGTLVIGGSAVNAVTLGAGASLLAAADTTSILRFTDGASAITLTGGTYDFSSGTVIIDLAGHFNEQGSYSLITGGASGIDAANYQFLGGADGLSYHFSGGVLTAIPEPSTYGLLGAGSLLTVAAVRRRLRRKAAASVAE